MRLLCFSELDLILRRPRSGRLEGWAAIPIVIPGTSPALSFRDANLGIAITQASAGRNPSPSLENNAVFSASLYWAAMRLKALKIT